MIVTYRKTKQGDWVAYGPTDVVRVGQVTVTRRDGTAKAETVERVGRPFDVNGKNMVYGYLAPRGAPRPGSGRPKCAECGTNAGLVECQDSSGLVAPCCHRCASMSWFERSFA